MRSTCPCIEDDYIPARYTRYAKQRNFDMDPRYEALLDVSFWSSHHLICTQHDLRHTVVLTSHMAVTHDLEVDNC